MSRYRHRVRKSRIRHDSRTLPIKGHKDYGEGRDVGKYYRCWNCGFVCDIDRDALGDSQSKSGVGHEIYPQHYSGKVNSTADYVETDPMIHGDNSGEPLVLMLSIRSAHVVLQNNAVGQPKTVRLNWKPVVNSGCPLCGSLNYRGDY